MFEKIKEKMKSKTFWACVASAVAGVLAGSVEAPKAILDVITAFFGG